MTSLLQGQVALVTGGTKGFGRGIAEALHHAGAQVFITGRDEKALRLVADRLDVVPLKADATSSQDWDLVMTQLLNKAGRIDILVNNAGGGVKIAATEEQSDESIASAIALNLTSTLFGCRRVAPLLRKQGSGTIINISSSCAHHAWPGWGIYSAAKAGVNQFSKSLYLELRPYGVRVTTISPSWGATEFTEAAGLGSRDSSLLERCIQPSDIGKTVVDLCTLPVHLCIQEMILWPMVQDVSPL